VILEVRLRTGFYETKPYRLTEGRGVLKLLPEEPGEELLILQKEKILSVTFIGLRFAGPRFRRRTVFPYHLMRYPHARRRWIGFKRKLGTGMF
jgi:hypothetical protein